MAIVKTNYLKHEDDYYEIIPPVPTESDRGGIVASTKTSTDTVEAKLGDDGKLYVPSYPNVNAAISAHNTNTSAHTDIQERLNELESNPYTLPQATGSTLGGVTIGDNVQVSNGKISVKNSTTSQPGVVQLTDSTSSTSTTTAATPNSVKKAYDLANTAKTNAANAQTAADEAKASAVTAQTTAESGVSKANAVQSAVDALNDEVTAHTGNSDVHFTAAERTKLSGIEAGAQKNTIIGVKGSSESSYRTGNVNITKANIGLGNVNNTADSAKPVSTAQQTAIDSALAEAKSYTDTKISGHNHDTKYDTKGAADVALDEAKDYTDTKVANLASTTVVDNKISSHNVSTSSHNDIRGLITALTTKVNNFLDVDDTTTDQLSEVLTLINNNKGTLDSLTSGKVNVSDIVDNLTTSNSTKVLSAKQGVALKGLIDTLQTALDALESEFDGHGHAIADVSGLQTALDGKAVKSHGTHVSYSTTAPVMDGKASVGSASTVSRSDHKHPTDTSRASQVELDGLEEDVNTNASTMNNHIGNTTMHITAKERTDWNDAVSKEHTHSNKTVLDNTSASFTTDLQNKLNALPTDDELTATYMTKENPTGTGSFSMNRLAGTTIGNYSHAEGDGSEASGVAAHAEGSGTTASAWASHAEGNGSVSSGVMSHAEGIDTEASNRGSHAEGDSTIASGQGSHAEGLGSSATGEMSHAEGVETHAAGVGSHSEGVGSIAEGEASHAEGGYTFAFSDHQHVQGRYNVGDSEGVFAHIVGNGTDEENRSNAHTLDWEGNAWFAGDVISTDANGNSVSLNELNSNIFNMIYPVGSIYMSVNSTNPGDLFGGTWESWGSGRVPVGVNADDSNFDTVEKSGGESTHTLTTDEMAKHTHTFTGSAVTSGTGGVAHTHSIPPLNGYFTYDIFNHIHNVNGNVASNGSHSHTLHPLKVIKDGGSGTAKNRVVGNPSTSGSSDSSGNYGTSLAGSHYHSLNLNTGTATISSLIPTDKDIQTNASTSGAASATSHTHSVTAKGTNSNTGSGSAHNNLQPYITCYMWKRIA